MKKYENFVSNLDVLIKANQEDLTNDFIVSGIIDKFSIQFELGWKTLKEILLFEGNGVAKSGSPREIIKSAYTLFFQFMDEEIWIKMLNSRNDITHIYDGDAAKKLVQLILKEYIPEFVKLKDGLINRYGEKLEVIDSI